MPTYKETSHWIDFFSKNSRRYKTVIIVRDTKEF